MRERDLKAIEFDKVRALVRQLCASEPGRRHIDELTPSLDPGEVRDRLRATAEMTELRSHSGSVPIADFDDLTSILTAAALEGSVLDGVSLLRVRDFVLGARHTEAFLRPRVERFARVAAIAADLLAPKELADALLNALADDGGLLDDASRELKKIRNRLRDERLELETRLGRALSGAGMESFVADYIVTVRNRRFVLPLKLNYGEKLDGIVQDRSVSGETLFVEPMWAVELNNRLMMLEREAEAEQRRIYERLTGLVRGYRRELRLTLSAMIKLDALNARAIFAERYECSAPEIVDREIGLKSARHPLLVASGREVIPIDIAIGAGTRGIVISGPNTGGKTVALKTLGLLIAMAQSGLMIPAEAGAKLMVFRALFVDIGDNQSIEADLSSFSAHIANLTEITKTLRAPALVILDEPGAGTDPTEGSALTIGLLEFFAARNCIVAVATHSAAVKLYAYAQAGLESAAVDFDAERLRPLFRLKPNTIGRSYGLAVARRLGLPDEIIAAAEKSLPAGSGELERALLRLDREREELAARIASLRDKEQELSRQSRELAAEKSKVHERAQSDRARIRSEGEELLRGVRDSGAELIAAIRSGAKSRRDLRAFASETTNALDRVLPRSDEAGESDQGGKPLAIGDQVALGDIRGELLALDGDKAVVGRGALKIEVAASRLRRSSKPIEPARNPPSIRVIAAPSESAELNIIGMRAGEALKKLEEFLDQSYLTNQTEVRVVHGIGSGALRKAVHEYLESSPYCASFREAEPRLGGSGATIVELEG
ncbi:MAG TPA: endonuclease MutS2 [Candidatus Binataceae bacterium]|jgi:DNA mismatch repair protein MutS2